MPMIVNHSPDEAMKVYDNLVSYGLKDKDKTERFASNAIKNKKFFDQRINKNPSSDYIIGNTASTMRGRDKSRERSVGYRMETGDKANQSSLPVLAPINRIADMTPSLNKRLRMNSKE